MPTQLAELFRRRRAVKSSRSASGRGKDVADAARSAAEAGEAAVVAAGGDGTISAVSSALAGSDIPLGVLPLGTLNHFAKDLGLPLDSGRP